MVRAEAARNVLRVAEAAVDMFRELEPMGDRWVVMWAASISLLRSVGHTLESVDAKASLELRASVNTTFEQWRKAKDAYPLFWFIDDARNLVLKKGTVASETRLGSAGQSVAVSVGSGDHKIGYPIYDARFSDRDQHEFLQEAISWWHEQLDLVEADANATIVERRSEERSI